MRSTVLLLQGFAAATAVVAQEQEYTRCYTPITGNPPPELDTEITQDEVEKRSLFGGFEIDTYVHVITTEAKEGMYPRSMVEDQMRVMNEEYGPSGFSFNTKSIDFSVNDTWATTVDGPVEIEYKTALRKGTYDDLNLYFLSDLGGGLLGFCYFPERNPSDLQKIIDGCVNLAGSMPGAEVTNYNMGFTAVHETGHWLGLYHVFQGQSCDGLGDYVLDTPAQKNATRGCPTIQDSCPWRFGLDSIHNFMDYSYDECLERFTPLQSLRMLWSYATLRLGR
ncbi:hypothetical protein KC315_g7060 [Hortaea werneckii]|nr:hypothetical protein KC315_g7060 [Hortaea werneckii]